MALNVLVNVTRQAGRAGWQAPGVQAGRPPVCRQAGPGRAGWQAPGVQAGRPPVCRLAGPRCAVSD